PDTVAGEGGDRMPWRRWGIGLAVLVALGALALAGRLLDLVATQPPAAPSGSSAPPLSSTVPVPLETSPTRPPATFPGGARAAPAAARPATGRLLPDHAPSARPPHLGQRPARRGPGRRAGPPGAVHQTRGG